MAHDRNRVTSAGVSHSRGCAPVAAGWPGVSNAGVLMTLGWAAVAELAAAVLMGAAGLGCNVAVGATFSFFCAGVGAAGDPQAINRLRVMTQMSVLCMLHLFMSQLHSEKLRFIAYKPRPFHK